MRCSRGAAVAAVVASLVVAPVGVGAASAASTTRAGDVQASAAKKHHRRAVNRRIYKRFSLLHKRKSARPADFELLPPLPFGVDLSAARTVTTPNGVTVTVAPGASGACILMAASSNASRTVGIGCSPIATTLAGEQWTYNTALGGPGGTLVGIAPDNDVAAVVTHADGSPERVAVVNNVWSVKGHASGKDMPFNRIQVQDKDGTYITAFTGSK